MMHRSKNLKTLLQEEINAWVNEDGRSSDDESP
jgi:hypothetical protein